MVFFGFAQFVDLRKEPRLVAPPRKIMISRIGLMSIFKDSNCIAFLPSVYSIPFPITNRVIRYNYYQVQILFRSVETKNTLSVDLALELILALNCFCSFELIETVWRQLVFHRLFCLRRLKILLANLTTKFLFFFFY